MASQAWLCGHLDGATGSRSGTFPGDAPDRITREPEAQGGTWKIQRHLTEMRLVLFHLERVKGGPGHLLYTGHTTWALS